MKIPARAGPDAHACGALLLDMDEDPGQEHPLRDSEIEALMIGRSARLRKANDRPLEQFQRLGM